MRSAVVENVRVTEKSYAIRMAIGKSILRIRGTASWLESVHIAVAVAILTCSIGASEWDEEAEGISGGWRVGERACVSRCGLSGRILKAPGWWGKHLEGRALC